MSIFLAALPILVVLSLMVLAHWSGTRAGIAGWLTGVLCASVAFGLNFQVLWVSQAKGLYLSFYVLAVLVPAIFLYQVVERTGGIDAVSDLLKNAIHDRGWLALLLAWAFSGMLEGLAGFGLPVAIIAPMLVTLDIHPLTAVAAVAAGHAWSVTFGDMGVIFQTLTAIVRLDAAYLAPMTVLVLGVACLLCGLSAALILRQGRHWARLLVVGVVMSAVQAGLALLGLTPLSAFGAGLSGVAVGIFLVKNGAPRTLEPTQKQPLINTLVSYGGLTLLMATVFVVPGVRAWLNQVAIIFSYPAVETIHGQHTEAVKQVFTPLTHPGMLLLLVGILSAWIYQKNRHLPPAGWKHALEATWKAAAPASTGIILMVGLSTLMEHTGMTQTLAQALSQLTGSMFPVVSPLVGMLGAFATGSNNNSNVLFAPLQQSAARLLEIDGRVLLAAQTAGGALGSMIAPAKLILGCSTVNLRGREGDVLRRTLPYGLGIGVLLGVLAWFLSS
ncbi:MAG TPA: L-lactate permease [Anaerolineaceae bacterium]